MFVFCFFKIFCSTNSHYNNYENRVIPVFEQRSMFVRKNKPFIKLTYSEKLRFFSDLNSSIVSILVWNKMMRSRSVEFGKAYYNCFFYERLITNSIVFIDKLENVTMYNFVELLRKVLIFESDKWIYSSKIASLETILFCTNKSSKLTKQMILYTIKDMLRFLSSYKEYNAELRHICQLNRNIFCGILRRVENTNYFGGVLFLQKFIDTIIEDRVVEEITDCIELLSIFLRENAILKFFSSQVI